MSIVKTCCVVAALASALSLAGVGAASAQADEPTVVVVRLSDYKYSPAQLELVHGRRYVLRLTNTGGKAHDLSARAFFQTVTLAPDAAAKVHNGAVDVEKNASLEIALVPQKPGTYEMHCTHPLHSMLGMKGEIVVN